MNAKRKTSLMLIAWGCAVGLPASLADAHGNNPKPEYGSADETLEQPPKEPPHADSGPKARSMLQPGHSVVSRRGGVLPGLPDLKSDIDSPFDFEEIDLTQDPSNGMRAMLMPGPAPYAGPTSADMGGLLPEADFRAAQLPGLPKNGAVPAPGTLAILGMAAAIAGRRRRRHA